MKKMFLVSSFKDVASIVDKFEKELSGKKITFIPTASKVEKIIATYSNSLDLKPINNKQAILVNDQEIKIETL